MKITLVCPASLPATQFGGIMFLGVEIATELAKKGHNVTIFTTDLDFANNASTFNKNLSRKESIKKYLKFKKKDLANKYKIKIEYLELRNIKSLKNSNNFRNSKIFIAYYINKIRLIDNL